MTHYDALMLVSFGGPEANDDVIPFLQNVTRGKNIPEGRLAEVGQHYYHFHGVSPINAQNRALIAALQQRLDERGIDLPVYFGNRNWHPLLEDTFRTMDADGVKSVLCLVTSAFSSYSGCRQYRENLAAAAEAAGVIERIKVDKIRHYFDHPGFVETMVDSVVAAWQQVAQEEQIKVFFTTHSIPTSAAATSGPPGWYQPEAGGAYVQQQLAVCELVAELAGTRIGRPLSWELVYQSRSGPPHIPWLEPDVNDALAAAQAQGVTAVVLVPIGFVSDHMEVVWDLDTEAMASAADLGLRCVRADTVGTHATFVDGLVDLIVERLHDTPVDKRPALTKYGPSYDLCPANCCPNTRGAKPALCGVADSTLSDG